jgi:TDG/mug DNA glycosylase family protein
MIPRKLDPGEFRDVLNFGIGLTDIVKTASGSDASLPRDADDVVGFMQRIRLVRPRIVAFNGKRAAAAFYGRPSRDLAYGPGCAVTDFPPVWVLPSTSGAACGVWSAEPWQRMAELIGSR